VVSREERRRAVEERHRAVRRQRRLLGAVLCIGLLGVVVIALPGSDGASRTAHGAGAQAPTRRRPPATPLSVDRALRYTDYVLSGSPGRREIALTFDDGPGPYTPKIVRILEHEHVPATFFPVGRPITAFGAELGVLKRGGFPIGDHTMTHPLMGHLSTEAQTREIDGQAGLLTGRGIAYPRFFRPPDGSFDQTTRGLLKARRMLMVLWSVNPEDYFRPGVGEIVKRVMRGARPGAIVLMHDGGGDRSQTVAALPQIIRRLRARKLRPVSVPELLHDDPPPKGQPAPPNLAGV
jgi:peptidoglycan/xylan/chitin deacetylase (PgdA/CDA1 family)